MALVVIVIIDSGERDCAAVQLKQTAPGMLGCYVLCQYVPDLLAKYLYVLVGSIHDIYGYLKTVVLNLVLASIGRR